MLCIRKKTVKIVIKQMFYQIMVLSDVLSNYGFIKLWTESHVTEKIYCMGGGGGSQGFSL